MKRREFVEKLGIGSAGLVSGAVLAGGAATPAAHDDQDDHQGHRPISGALSNATVSFGQWKTAPALDRFGARPDPTTNNHQLIPYRATIKAGGSVNFIISGLHQVAVYAPGKTPEGIDTSVLRLTTGTIAGVALINDGVKRIYAGPDPGGLPLDRVEVVHFPDPGLHLVICAVELHFIAKMWGYVNVLRRGRDDE